MEKKLMALDCPRCGPRVKKMLVDMEKHGRECPECHYQFEYREGMPAASGEFEPVSEASASAPETAPAPAPATEESAMSRHTRRIK
jgi:endogenous inhibitor of DNA gyrase (YacG/DUF329 family)